MHFDVELELLVRDQIFGVARRVAMRAIEAGTGDLGYGAVRRDVGNAHEPVGTRCIGRDLDNAAREFADCLRGKGKEGAAAFAMKQAPPWVETYSEKTEA